jgi:hypothetical protein
MILSAARTYLMTPRSVAAVVAVLATDTGAALAADGAHPVNSSTLLSAIVLIIGGLLMRHDIMHRT